MEIYIGIFMYFINYFDVTVTAPNCPDAELALRSWRRELAHFYHTHP